MMAADAIPLVLNVATYSVIALAAQRSEQLLPQSRKIRVMALSGVLSSWLIVARNSLFRPVGLVGLDQQCTQR